ncbi:Hypothetical protein GbCGDNIH3_5094 [Granulibacter bethesdensis]|uniref:Uncharacterized protein n=1 Tax=Granulibacter bethesdensis TaxID=364410 RepID=A0AAN0RDE0_9PROT|nr:Hypothetical protein GbCGDNIH3_5094 [Granulibacter bethesdensis]APH59310.1 Hypothetical protein GbCGDNIH7_5094 [Granulibacter bethesdensis]
MPLREPISNQNRPDMLSSIRRFILITEQLWQEKDEGHPLNRAIESCVRGLIFMIIWQILFLPVIGNIAKIGSSVKIRSD